MPIMNRREGGGGGGGELSVCLYTDTNVDHSGNRSKKFVGRSQ